MESVLNTPYLILWIIGFIEVESSFSVYKSTKNFSFIGNFEITQTNKKIVILAIKKLLNLVPNVSVDKTNNYRLKVFSIRGI